MVPSVSSFDKVNYHEENNEFRCNNFFEEDGEISNKLINKIYMAFYMRDNEGRINISDIVQYLKLSFLDKDIDDIIQIIFLMDNKRKEKEV